MTTEAPTQPTTEESADRAQWGVPRTYPYAPDQNPNPGKQRVWVHELTQQVQWLTELAVSLTDRIGELETKAKKPPPKTVTTPKAKSEPKED